MWNNFLFMCSAAVFVLQRQGSGAAAGNNKISGGQGKQNKTKKTQHEISDKNITEWWQDDRRLWSASRDVPEMILKRHISSHDWRRRRLKDGSRQSTHANTSCGLPVCQVSSPSGRKSLPCDIAHMTRTFNEHSSQFACHVSSWWKPSVKTNCMFFI